MSVVIRMKRTGRRNRPCYRISVADKAAPSKGRTLETLGLYDPASPKPELRLKLDAERARYWVTKGAQPSDTVRSILNREGVFEGLPTPTTKKRAGRKRPTAKNKRRVEAQKERSEAKSKRHQERVAQRRAAKAAAAAAAAESSEAE